MNQNMLIKILIRHIRSKQFSNNIRNFASISEYQKTVKQSLDNKIEFWNEASKEIHWIKTSSKILDDSIVHSPKWFSDGEMNMCYNCVDVHVKNGFGDQTAIIYDSPISGQIQNITYKQLLESVSKLGGIFNKYDIKKGDVVLIYLPMIPQTLMTMLACARLGLIHSLVFGGFAAKELAVRIKHCEPKLIVSTNVGLEPNRFIDYNKILNEAIKISGFSPKKCLIYNRPGYKRVDSMEGRDLDWEDEIHQVKSHDAVSVEGNHPLYILYTSGTTGTPKGIVRPTAGYAVALKWSMKNLYGVNPGETVWTASDFGWVVGHSYICYGPLLQRCTTLIYEGKPVGTPDSSQYFRVLNWHKPVMLFTAPTTLRAIRQENPNGTFHTKYDYPHLKRIFVAGEHCDINTLNWAKEIFRVPVLDHWWQTETGWAITCPAAGLETVNELVPPPGSAGKPVPGYDVKILDSNSGEILGPTKLGRIVVKLPLPPGMASTLYKNENMFYEIFFSKFPGYYDTMDAGMCTESGHIMVMSRDDDVLNVAGHRISCSALEEACLENKAIVECAVVGLNDSLKGQIPLALLVQNKNVAKSNKDVVNETIEIVRKCIGPVASFKTAVVVEKLPKTRSGKISRSSIAAMANGKPFKAPPTLEDPNVFDSIYEAFLTLGLKPSRPD